MTGTLLNMLTVGTGGLLGLLLGRRLPAKLQVAIMNVLGLFTSVLGVSMALKTQNPLVLLASLLAGTATGEWIDLDKRLENLGLFLQERFGAAGSRHQPADLPSAAATRPGFVAGFVGASLLFCVGPMSIMGAIQDGLTGDYSTLAIKAVMDGFAAMVMASSLGPGVIFSALTILAYQGSITMAAGLVQGILTDAMVSELTAAGGILIFAIGLGLLEIKRIRVANMLPAIFFAPLAYHLSTLLR